jgi:uncharacterized protein (DUF58 family)
VSIPVPTVLGLKGIVFFAVLLGSFFAATYANLFFLLMAFLTVLGGLNLLWTARSLSGVSGCAVDGGPLPSGGGHHLTVRVRAGKRPRRCVAAEATIAGHGRVAGGAGVVQGSVEIRAALPELPRGVHAVSRLRITSTWPFGLFRVSRPVAGVSELVVYPSPAEAPGLHGGEGTLGDLCAALGYVDGNLQPSGLREHRPEDGLRRIHWKASARRDRLVVTEWEGGGGTGAEVVLDRRAAPEEFEHALAVLAALALAAREEKEPLTVHSQGLSATYGPGHTPTAEFLRWLAQAVALPPDGAPPPPVSPGILHLPASGGGARR